MTIFQLKPRIQSNIPINLHCNYTPHRVVRFIKKHHFEIISQSDFETDCLIKINCVF